MRNPLLSLALLSLVFTFTLAAAPAVAQEESDPAATARLRLGPLALTPTISVTNIGIDTNVFNEVENPKRDFTATFGPQAEAWLRLGRARLHGKSRLDVVYFRDYESERSLNSDSEARLELLLNRFKPYVGAAFLRTRQRPDYEIDARSRRIEQTIAVGGDVRVSGRTTFGLAARRSRVDFDAEATFLGTRLRDVLNREEEGATLSFRHRLTPLTSIVVLADAQRDRFEFSPARDADSVRVTPGVEFDTFALVTGKALVGYRTLDFLGLGIPDFRGPVASIDLGYTLLGVTRFAVRADRDASYSFEIQEPYFVQTSLSGQVTQSITHSWDVVARGGRQRLDYRRQGMTPAPPQNNAQRIDTVWTYGGGLGFRVGRDARLGANVDYHRRHSIVSHRDYEGLRFGTSITYGF